MTARAYRKLRELVRVHGGRMDYLKKGYQWGAWRIELGGRVGIFPSVGARTFKFDPCYKLMKGRSGKTWNDFHNELEPEALERLRRFIASAEVRKRPR